MPRPCQHAHAVSASSTRESAWLDIFGRNAQQSENSNFYVKFCQTSFRLPYPHSWHQFHFSHHHRVYIPLIIACYPTTGITTTFAFTTTTTTITSTISNGESLLKCDRTFTSRIGLVGHLQIHRTETGEPVPGAPTTDRDRHLHCPLSSRTFNHRMGLFGRHLHCPHCSRAFTH
ncbi:unnamed protein product [Schistocephalus solidus]|uniref:C2H2-type domain-containing protein n=1 Tax=Schistocephalus solidus TaxID=70667 RepID=A0A183T339_SCHSO|nr:unnamed protein product [Schistocephalus solidus]